MNVITRSTWKPLNERERLDMYRAKLQPDDEGFIRRQAIGVAKKESLLRRIHQIPRQRSLVPLAS